MCTIHIFFFFNDPATTEIYTLSLHDALPISFQKVHGLPRTGQPTPDVVEKLATAGLPPPLAPGGGPVRVEIQDRKSTRLNSSHANISYAVFCLKKKKNKSHYCTSFLRYHHTV